MTKETDIIIIGAGPVGLFTVFEAGLLGLECILIDNLDKIGGQCSELYPEKPIYDIPGVPNQTAQEHVDALVKQIEPFSYDLILNERVDELSENNGSWTVATNAGKRISTKKLVAFLTFPAVAVTEQSHVFEVALLPPFCAAHCQ